MQDTTQAATEATPKRYQCRHIFTDGHRCGSPCLHHEEFCYYHHTTRRPAENPRRRRHRHAQFDLPLPEDRSSIQSSIGEVLRRIASNEIDTKRAGLLLYGLQIASLNLPRPAVSTRSGSSSRREARPEPEPIVEEIVLDPTYGTLAPKSEVQQQQRRKSFVEIILENLKDDKQLEAEEAAEEAVRAKEIAENKQAGARGYFGEPTTEPATTDPTAEEPTILPTLQAQADSPCFSSTTQHTVIWASLLPSAQRNRPGLKSRPIPGASARQKAKARARRGEALHSHPSQKRDEWGTRAFLARFCRDIQSVS